MQPSTLARLVRDRVSLSVQNQLNNKNINDPISLGHRDAFFLSQFNIISSESVLKQPLTDLKVPVLSWPLIDLPTHKLQELKVTCKYFKERPFRFKEDFYSSCLWYLLLYDLFGDHDNFKVESEYCLSRIESNYRKLRTDFVARIKNKDFAPPLLFLELSKEILSGESVGHKDELKISFTLGAALLKLIGLNWQMDKEFLSNIRVYGILAGATSFDICAIYPVFPNEDKTDFYFVFDCSRSQLRFQIFENNKYSPEERFCLGSYEVINTNPRFQHVPQPPVSENYITAEGLNLYLRDVGIFESDAEVELYPQNQDNEEINEAQASQTPNEDSEASGQDSVYVPGSCPTSPDDSIKEEPSVASESIPAPFTPWKELECLDIFKNGIINERSLQVLERLVDLVKAQCEHLAGMTNTSISTEFRYDPSRIDLVIPRRYSHTGSSPNKNVTKRSLASNNEDNSPTKHPRLTNTDLGSSNDTNDKFEMEEMDELLNKFYKSENKENENMDKNVDVDGYGDGNKNIRDKMTTSAISKAITNMDNESRRPKKRCFIFKNSSKHEIKIYENEIIRKSVCFPKYFGFTDNNKDKECENDIRIELEEIIPGHQIDFSQFYDSVALFGAKFLVDIYGALITLHSIGYIHGDVTPGNVGFNEELGIWQLFDFDNARPIEEAALGKGDYHGTKGFKSQNYLNTGKYGPFDDFVGATKTFFQFYLNVQCFAQMFDVPVKKDYFHSFSDAFIRRVKPINIESLHRMYFTAVKLLWKTCKKNPKDPSIINAKRILMTPNFIKK